MPLAKVRYGRFLSASSSSSYQTFRYFTCSILHPKFVDSKVSPKPIQKPSQKPVDPKAAQEALDYCLKIVRFRDYENYVATLLMPKPVQSHVISIFALNAEVAVIRHKIKKNSGVTGVYQLQFWKDALNSIYGRQSGPAPRQPVVTALRAFASTADVDLLQNLVTARTDTLGDRPFRNVESLEKNSDAIYGSLIKLVAQALDPLKVESKGHACEDAASAMGKAVGMLNLLRATVPLLKEGVVLLPSDLVAIHGLDENSIYSNNRPDAFKALSKDMCDTSKYIYLKQARSHLTSIDRRIRPAFVASGSKVDYMLRIFENSDYNIVDARLQTPYPLLSWQLWWRNLIGFY